MPKRKLVLKHNARKSAGGKFILQARLPMVIVYTQVKNQCVSLVKTPVRQWLDLPLLEVTHENSKMHGKKEISYVR